MREYKFPWKQPISHYDSDGPRDLKKVIFEIDDIKMSIEVNGILAMNTMRDCYRVICLTCDKTIHSATTSATILCEDHLRESHDIFITGI